MEVSEAEEGEDLRDENPRLKKLVTDLSLDKDMLQSVIEQHQLVERRADVKRLRAEFRPARAANQPLLPELSR
jgi:hypothetical protein